VAKDPSDCLSPLTSVKSYFSESRYSARYFPTNIPWPMTHLLNWPGGSTVCSPLLAQITPNRAQQSFPMTWGMRAMPRNGRPPAIGGSLGPGGLIVVSGRNYLLNCPGGSTACFPLPAQTQQTESSRRHP